MSFAAEPRTDLKEALQRLGQLQETLRQTREELTVRTCELARADQQLRAEVAQCTRAAEARQVAEQSYRHLFENATDLVFTADLNLLVTSVNRAGERISGYRRKELLGKPATELVAPEAVDAAHQMFRAKLGGRESTTYELPILTKDGRQPVLEFSTCLLFQEGRPVGVQGIARDITDRKRAEEALRDSEAALQRSSEQLRALAASLFRAQEEERRRLSRELHDDLNQRLAMLAVEAEAVEQKLPPAHDSIRAWLQALRKEVVALSDDLRRLAYQLHPTIIEHLGLGVALKTYCAEFARRHRVRVKFICRDLPARLSQDVALCLYRAAQEGLRNVAKHSQSPRATVVLSGGRQGLHLSITDFGVGFDPGSMEAKGGLGIISMEERVRLVGGSLALRSRSGGTRLDVRVPWPGEVT